MTRKAILTALLVLLPATLIGLTVDIPAGSNIVSNGIHPDPTGNPKVLIEHYPLENAISFEMDFVTPMALTFSSGLARFFDEDGAEILAAKTISQADFWENAFSKPGGNMTGPDIAPGARIIFFFPHEFLPHNLVPATVDVYLCFEEFAGPNGECDDPLAFRDIAVSEYHTPKGQTYVFPTRQVGDFRWIAGGGHELEEKSHRRGGLRLSGSRAWGNQRYAYDIALINDDEWDCASCDNNNNCSTGIDCRLDEDYFCWGQDLIAMAGGQVVLLTQGNPDNSEPRCDFAGRQDCSGCTGYDPLAPDGTCPFAPGAAECNGYPDVGKCSVPDPTCPVGAGKFPGSGNEVVLLHPNGEYTTYAHMRQGSNDHLSCGQFVTRGTKIGEIGMTGSGSNPHNHFSSLDKEGPEDPDVENFPIYFNNVEFTTPGQTVARRQLDVSLRSGTIIDKILSAPGPVARNPGLPSGVVQEIEPNDTVQDHNALVLPTTVQGSLETGEVGNLAVRGDGIEDIFRVDLNNPDSLRITLETLTPGQNLDVYAMDSDYRVMNETRQGTNLSGPEALCLDLDEGAYYVMVTNVETNPIEPADYELSIVSDLPVVSCEATGTADPIEMDGNCTAEVGFEVTLHDNCCLREKTLDLQVNPTVVAGTVSVGDPVVDSIQPLDERNMRIRGHVEVSGLSTCSADLRLDVTASDCTGNSVTTAAPGAACLVSVTDAMMPTVQAPPDELVECDAVPAPGVPVVEDNCDGSPDLDFSSVEVPGNCPGNYTIERTWEAQDNCFNSDSDTQTIKVQDTTPPEITTVEDDLFCLWPPDHRMVLFGAGSFAPRITDNCSEPITWRFDDCPSDQPEDSRDQGDPAWNGDGRTRPDCSVAGDGRSFEVRAERAGTGPGAQEGRRYGVEITATDACGNTSAPGTIGRIHVPHDGRDGRTKGCR